MILSERKEAEVLRDVIAAEFEKEKPELDEQAWERLLFRLHREKLMGSSARWQRWTRPVLAVAAVIIVAVLVVPIYQASDETVPLAMPPSQIGDEVIALRGGPRPQLLSADKPGAFAKEIHRELIELGAEVEIYQKDLGWVIIAKLSDLEPKRLEKFLGKYQLTAPRDMKLKIIVKSPKK